MRKRLLFHYQTYRGADQCFVKTSNPNLHAIKKLTETQKSLVYKSSQHLIATGT
jgi:hypothetical protein